ncbi:SDR family NAD(P)-dependent oxidoreductase [Methylocystis echinoides]|uniref:Dehydrogenase n=1 Tax=Methylocystis echinoides TaxID=29468 RepID=A0A9W6GUK5_9HYPH|nr:SDR family NAD(P)-dependent oxidoreductase [Methylocystis echinoides]GLI93342.1 dehydrogenase [Methylocystis echinoides]
MSALPVSDSWVLVTGASSGLGRAAALRLAGAYRAKPILVGRRIDSLRDLQSEIATRFEIASDIIAADQSTAEGRARIVAGTEARAAIAALLAAGVTSVGRFDAEKTADYGDLIETNVAGFTDLLARLVTLFKSRGGATAVLAVSSLGAETSLPYQAVYGASKAYTNTLIQALAVELRGTGVSVGAFLPGGIDTPMAAQSDLRWGRMGLMDADRCAALAVDALVRRRRLTVPGLGNRLIYLASRALARPLVARAASLPYRQPD